MTRCLLSLILVAVCSLSTAAPIAKIEALDKIEVGQLLQLSPGDSVGEHFSWLVIPETNDFALVGDTCFFSARKPGQFIFVLAVSDTDGIATDTITVTVGKPVIPPTPVKTLADLVVDWASEVTTQNKATEAKALAAAFRATTAKIGAGVLGDAESIIGAQTQANKDAVGDNALERWLPWRQKLAEYLDAESEAASLSTPKAHIPYWELIAEGLEEVTDG